MSTQSTVSTEKIIQFVIKHNTVLIEALIATVLLITLYLAYRSYKSSDDTAVAGGLNLSELEETLKKLLEKASLVPSPGSASAGNAEGGSASAELLVEIEMLKKGLEDRQLEIEKLKNSPNSAGAAAGSGGVSNEDKAKLEAQLKELQGKLAEYEIISEDIADLSFYKEENAKLKKQLEGGGAAPAAPVAAVAPAAPAPVSTAAPASAAVPVAESVQTPAVVTEEEKKKPEPEIVGKAKSKDPETSLSTEPAPAQANKVEESVTAPAEEQSILAEFDKAVEEQKDAAADLGSMDMDKMMAEAEDITQAPATDIDMNSLETTLDENKLLEEASALTTVKPEDKNLMNEFENFVKKG